AIAGLVEYVEAVGAELDRLLPPYREGFEERHINALVPRTMKNIGLPAQILNRCLFAGNFRTRTTLGNNAARRRIGEGAGVVPVCLVVQRRWAGAGRNRIGRIRRSSAGPGITNEEGAG